MIEQIKPNTYPEMNSKIVDILRISDEPSDLYAAQRIEELEREVERLREVEKNYNALTKIMDRARKLASQVEGEEDRIQFHMDADGNLRRKE